MIEILRYLTHMRTHLPAAALFALGHAGDFAVTLRGDGFNVYAHDNRIDLRDLSGLG